MFSSGLSYLSAAIPVGVFSSVAAMVLVFAIKNMFKPLGIILIVLGVIVVIATGAFGIVGFAMFVVADISALRYKQAIDGVDETNRLFDLLTYDRIR